MLSFKLLGKLKKINKISMNNMHAKIMLIGAGFHAKRIYIPELISLSKIKEVSLVVVVDILSKENEVKDYISNLKNGCKSLSVDELTKDCVLTEKTINLLDRSIQENNINGVIISTEPLSHKAYAKWALSRNLNILMDKPISTRKNLTTNLVQANGLYKDFEDLLSDYSQLQKTKNTIFTINTQRRFHPGFIKVKKLINEVTNLFNIPITSMQVMYADGTWVHPSEILNQNSHPYKFGYGKCSHSSYHIFDIIWQLFISSLVKEKIPDRIETFSSFLSPDGFDIQINTKDYKNYFGTNYVDLNSTPFDYRKKVENYGEIDAFNLLRLIKEESNICNISVNLIHNSFSRRAWAKPAKDLYKGNGRVKQQQFVIHQGPFQTIHIHNYQANDNHDIKANNEYEVGGNNHFDIYIFRNSEMFPFEEVSFQKVSMKELFGSNTGNFLTTENAKRKVILEYIEFILGEKRITDVSSNINTHLMPVKIMSEIYKSNILHLKNKNPIVSFKIPWKKLKY